jgi:hypothetical protein
MPSSPTPLARSSTLPLQPFLSSQVSKPWRLICGICLCLRCPVYPPTPILHFSRRPRLRFSPCSLCLQRVSWPTGIAPLARRLSPPSVVPSNKVSFAASLHLVAKYPPLSLSTSFGHLDLLRKGISSSRPKVPPSCLGPVASLPLTRRASPRLAAIHNSFSPDHSLAHIVHRSEWSAADLSARFPIPSHLGFEYILVFNLGFEYILVFNHLGYIHFVPLQSRTSSSYVSAFRLAVKILRLTLSSPSLS